MLSRPTTEQILLDCCRELMTGVLPALTDETAQVAVVMIETVLRNMAVRSAHEIAWMREEIDDIDELRAARSAARRRTPAPTEPRRPPRAACTSTTSSRRTAGPGGALSAALEAAVAGGACRPGRARRGAARPRAPATRPRSWPAGARPGALSPAGRLGGGLSPRGR